MSWLVDPHELEDKVGGASKIKENDYNHSHHVLPACPKSRHEEYEYRNRDGGNGKIEFDWINICDYDQELYRKAQEEEKVELQKRNVDLRTKISSL
jgi:hypothetical protein